MNSIFTKLYPSCYAANISGVLYEIEKDLNNVYDWHLYIMIDNGCGLLERDYDRSFWTLRDAKTWVLKQEVIK